MALYTNSLKCDMIYGKRSEWYRTDRVVFRGNYIRVLLRENKHVPYSHHTKS